MSQGNLIIRIFAISSLLFLGYVCLTFQQDKVFTHTMLSGSLYKIMVKGLYVNESRVPIDSYEERIKNIQKYCNIYRRNETMWKKVSMGEKPAYFWPFVSHGYNLLWAEVPKIASSTLKIHFSKLKKSKRDKRDTEIQKLLVKSSKDLKENWEYKVGKEGFTAFAFVRHPFARVLSAYRSKMENESSDGFKYYRAMNEKMAKKYRPEEMKVTINRTTSTFSEFLSAVADKFKSDRHWHPITRLIYPCDLRYNFIGRIETMEEDLNYLFTKVNASFIDRSVWKKKRDSDELLKHYYSTVSKQTLLRLYDYYKTDFQLFGYDMKEYLAYVES